MLKADELFIPETATVLDTMKRLDETGQRILFLAPEGRLKAVVTDGDIRKSPSGAAPGGSWSAGALTRCPSWTKTG